MTEQAPAGWYADGYGNERYWDGASWTEHLRKPIEADSADAGVGVRRDGAFAKVGAVVKKAATDKKTAREEFARKQVEDAHAAGALITSGVFGTSTVEIFEGSYVRVAGGEKTATQPAAITKKTPYERLRSIKLEHPANGKTSSTASPLDSAVGPAVAGLLKGGKAVFKGTAPGLAAAGIQHRATAEARTSFLTIATNRTIHILTNQSNNGVYTKVNKAHIQVALELEAIGLSLLGQSAIERVDPAPESQSTTEINSVSVAPPAASATPVERLRELAALHSDGILSDDEFSAAKAKLLESL